MIFFVTCGRGFEKFVKDELKQVEAVGSIMVIGEGKIMFCLCENNQTTCGKCTIVQELSKSKQISENINKLDCYTQPLNEKYSSIINVDKIVSLLGLKLVEKIYILLLCKFLKEVEGIQISDSFFLDAVKQVHFTEVMTVAKAIKYVSGQNQMEWRQCSDPDSCPAFGTRQQEKHRYRKRKVESDNRNHCDVNYSKRFQNSAFDTYKSDCLNSSNISVDKVTNLKECKNEIQQDSDLSYRVSCRVRGIWRSKFKPFLLSQEIASILSLDQTWISENKNPILDIYANLNDENFIVGASLSEKPLSLRPYMPHITLRSTVCNVMVRSANILDGFTILDPMCGAGTILLEAANCVPNLRIIASDIEINQLNAAKCNLRDFNAVEFVIADATSLPLKDGCVDALVCDFPFGKKFSIGKCYKKLLQDFVVECSRVVKKNSTIVILLSAQQKDYLNNLSETHFVDLQIVHPFALGLTPAFVCILRSKGRSS